MTTGQLLTSKLCAYFHVNSRTRRHRNGENLVQSMVEAVLYSRTDGWYGEELEAAFKPGINTALVWEKLVMCYRIPGEQICTLNQMTPMQFAKYFGEMVDAGVTNAGAGEEWFKAQRNMGR